MEEQAIRKLADDWRAAGVEQGDTLLLHSSLSRTLRRLVALGTEPAPRTILLSFLAALGSEGTLLLPLFNFGFARGEAFDLRATKSEMGALTECGRTWPGAVRTGHPIYSFAAIGARAGRFGGIANFSGYGADSPFGTLHRDGGKIAVLDLPDQNSMTFYHYVEESLSVPYRYHKTFTGAYIDGEGVSSEQTFGLFVRNLEQGVTTHVDPMGELLWKAGSYRGFRPKEGCGLRVIAAATMFDEVAAVIRDGQALGNLYATA